MERIDVKTAQALHAVGFRPDCQVLPGLFGEGLLSGAGGDFPLPSWAEVAEWLEDEKGIVITRMFPERYHGSKWVNVRVIFRMHGLYPGFFYQVNHVPARLGPAIAAAVKFLITENLI